MTSEKGIMPGAAVKCAFRVIALINNLSKFNHATGSVPGIRQPGADKRRKNSHEPMKKCGSA